ACNDNSGTCGLGSTVTFQAVTGQQYHIAVGGAADGAVGAGVLTITCPTGCSADYNHDGDVGTDADINDFFRCLAGSCCASCDSADFNGDGDVGTDADIESFFRVLAGGPC